MNKMMSIGLVFLMSIMLGIPNLFAQQQAQPQPQQQTTVQCPMMAQGGMQQGGQGGANCPRMNGKCPMAAKPCCMMRGQQTSSADAGKDNSVVAKPGAANQ